MLSRVASPTLRLAARRIHERWQREVEAKPSETELTLELVSLCQGLEAAAGTTPPSPSFAPLRRRLLDLLRAEVVALWSEGDIPPASTEMLALFAAFERLRDELDSASGDGVGWRFTSPEGLSLISGVAHDLRSPLTSILFLSETLRRGHSGELNHHQRRQIGLIYSAALGLISVASDMIELARGGQRLVERDPIAFSVTEVMESVHDIVQPMAEEKGLQVRFLPPAGDHRLGYPVALSRVLLNLTTNGIKFTEEGFVEIVARAKGSTRVEFSVRDSGKGINPSAVDDLYRPFRPHPAHGAYGFSGTGLGLSTCRTLVQAMGAELHYETSPTWGTRFFFDLDLPPVAWM